LSNTHQPHQIDKILLPHEAADFLGLTEDSLMNATLQGNCPGVCIDGQWRFSQRGLGKYLLQQDNHGTGMPWLEESCSPKKSCDAVAKETQEVIEKYKEGERYFPILDIEGGRFSGLDLSGIDFWDSNLPGADFSGSILNRSVFVAVNLKSAIFRDADLTDADFREAIIDKADFRGAILNRTIFEVESMSGVDLSGAIIRLAKF
ncbi:pentapeptide repeat-containing protein, partial [Acaryochloris marina NIES-2412]|uniref:pentapeptide repeat-containing protein n=1 Tax=Acaryochloris marina TaxID=155978 RepID=UPI00405A300E